MKKRILGYSRVSRDPKHDKLSPEIQREMLEEYCTTRGFELVDVVEDLDVKGGTFERPGWYQVERKITSVDAILFVAIDRFGRTLREAVNWAYKIQFLYKKEILSVHESFDVDTPAGRMSFYTLLMVAEFLRDMHGLRMKDVQDKKLRDSKWRGGPLSLGHDYLRKTEGERMWCVVVINESEAETVRDIYAKYLAGYSFRQIAFEFNEEGLTGKKGGRYNVSIVRSILRNPAYISKRRHKDDGNLHDVDIPRILDDATWEDVQARIAERTFSRDGNRAGSFLLSGLLTCGLCGQVMYRQKKYDKKPDVASWVCSGMQRGFGCSGTSVRDHIVEKVVVEHFMSLVDNTEFSKALQMEAQKARSEKKRLPALRSRLSTVERKQSLILDEYAKEAIDRDRWLREDRALERQRTDLLLLIDQGEKRKVLDKRIMQDFAVAWEYLDTYAKREALRIVFSRVVVKSYKEFRDDRFEFVYRFEEEDTANSLTDTI